MNQDSTYTFVFRVRTPTSALRQFKALCAARGLTMSEVVRALIEEWVAEREADNAER